MEATFNEPEGIAVASASGTDSYAIVADTYNHCIRLIDISYLARHAMHTSMRARSLARSNTCTHAHSHA